MSTVTSILIIQLILALSFSIVSTQQSVNNRPIIGVLAQEVSEYVNRKYPGHRSYIAASYVKFIEGAGARVVPIWIGKDKSYYEDIMSKINGVLWPGGGASFNNTNGYADAAYNIYKIAKRKNNEGVHFPIFAICLGFEVLTYVTANRRNTRRSCNAEEIAMKLEFERDYESSKLFRNAPAHIKDILATKNVTLNTHKYCVTKQDLKDAGIKDKFGVLSLNHDKNSRVKFISSLESVEYPFYGLQFHPEKNLYEWVIGKSIPHSENAIQISQYFANFFINEARKNLQKYPHVSEKLIYNYQPVYTGLDGLAYEQTYFFDKSI
ncbi:gamma-glutamyl hydrolase A-like [Hylaeus anthracinus]|uniref:gamma-glutamyl hydrolase A-like n=1 Tax=Hylaeus anthracinus TaxID=313031 RepID=UPI0023B96AF5|nr:gamma-glutamyl hydrolase A-like [Hylaeus anthracinus]